MTEKPTITEAILTEVSETRLKVETLERLAQLLAAPTTDGEESFLQLMIDTQTRLVDGMAQVQASLQTLHQALAEPNVVDAMRRALATATD